MYEPSQHLVYCFVCRGISDTTGDVCPCGDRGTLIPLARLIDPDPYLGKITLIVAESFTVRPKKEPSFYRPEKRTCQPV